MCTLIHTLYTFIRTCILYKSIMSRNVLCNICIQLQVYIEFTTLHAVYIMYSLTTFVLFAYSSVSSTNLPLLLLSSSEHKWP